jgi:hypothetical protein
MAWFRFFLGTPRRFCVTLAVLALATVVIFPSLLALAVARLLAAVMPLIGPALMIVIVFAGLRMIVGGGRRH